MYNNFKQERGTQSSFGKELEEIRPTSTEKTMGTVKVNKTRI